MPVEKNENNPLNTIPSRGESFVPIGQAEGWRIERVTGKEQRGCSIITTRLLRKRKLHL